MNMAIKHENDEFLVINLEHVSVLMVVVNCHRTPKLWAIAHTTYIKSENDDFLVMTLMHCIGFYARFKSPENPKTMVNSS